MLLRQPAVGLRQDEVARALYSSLLESVHKSADDRELHFPISLSDWKSMS